MASPALSPLLPLLSQVLRAIFSRRVSMLSSRAPPTSNACPEASAAINSVLKVVANLLNNLLSQLFDVPFKLIKSDFDTAAVDATLGTRYDTLLNFYISDKYTTWLTQTAALTRYFTPDQIVQSICFSLGTSITAIRDKLNEKPSAYFNLPKLYSLISRIAAEAQKVIYGAAAATTTVIASSTATETKYVITISTSTITTGIHVTITTTPLAPLPSLLLLPPLIFPLPSLPRPLF